MLNSRSPPESFCQTLRVRLFKDFNGPICQIIQKAAAPTKPLQIFGNDVAKSQKWGEISLGPMKIQPRLATKQAHYTISLQ